MDAANELLTDLYGRAGEGVPQVLEGLDVESAHRAPGEGANPIVWLVWHLTRVMDDHLADLVDAEQVWTAQGFADRFGLDLDPSDHGFGHNAEQVAKVRVEDLSLLGDYHAAVQAAYADYLARVTGLDQVIDDRWDPPVTLGVRLVSVADDMAKHLGQAEYVRGLLSRDML